VTSTPPELDPLGELLSEWKAEAGSIAMPRGLGKLHPGMLLLIDGAPLSGTPASPDGSIELVLDELAARSSFRARAEPGSNGVRLILESDRCRSSRPREALDLVTSAESTPDLPVTLVVELGRVKLPLATLAALRPGDVVELGRPSSQTVELTSGGRLVARGELVQVDIELGVRVTQVFPETPVRQTG
jgi:type III secretion system YscQ/HrcQ family protein